MQQEIRIGICGAGSFGSARAKACAHLDGVRVVLGWSRSSATRERFGRATHARVVPNWQDLCLDAEVDAVVVSTPNLQHVPQAEAALQAGKHVLVETPLSPTSLLAHRLADLAQHRGLVLHHGAKSRYHPDHATHIQRLRQVGRLLYGIEHAGFDFGPDRAWYGDRALAGGARAYLPYVMLGWMEAFGEVTSACGVESCADTWDSASITLLFTAGGYATISYAMGLGIPELSVRQVVGSAGMIQADPDGAEVLLSGDERTLLAPRPVDLVQCECQAFVDEIRGLRDHRAALAADLRALELVDQALGGFR